MNRDRAALLGLAALSVIGLIAIAAGAIFIRIPNDSQTLLGTIAGGLIGILRIPTNRQSDPAGTPSDPISTKDVING